MGIGAPTYPTDDTDVMSWGTHIGANMLLARAWLNGGVLTTDLNASEVVRDHVVRPEILGFPQYGLEGRIQHSYGTLTNHEGAPGSTGPDWATHRNRDTIYPYYVQATEIWRTRFGKTLRFDTDGGNIYASFHGNIKSSQEPNTGYPDGASGANTHLGGRLVICYTRRETGVKSTEVEHSRYFVYPELLDQFDCRARFIVSAGTYDVFLAYRRGTASADSTAFQFDLRNVQWVIEGQYSL